MARSRKIPASEDPLSCIIRGCGHTTSRSFFSISNRVMTPPGARGYLRIVDLSTSPMNALPPEAMTRFTPGGQYWRYIIRLWPPVFASSSLR